MYLKRGVYLGRLLPRHLGDLKVTEPRTLLPCVLLLQLGLILVLCLVLVLLLIVRGTQHRKAVVRVELGRQHSRCLCCLCFRV